MLTVCDAVAGIILLGGVRYVYVPLPKLLHLVKLVLKCGADEAVFLCLKIRNNI